MNLGDFMDLKDFEWTTRTSNSLKSAEIFTLQHLLDCTPSYLRKKVRGFGEKSIKEIEDKLKKQGLSLAKEVSIDDPNSWEILEKLVDSLEKVENELVAIRQMVFYLSRKFEQIQTKKDKI